MKKTILASTALAIFLAAPAFSEEPKRLMDETFVVETSENDAQDSLNRVAGQIDAGFAHEDSTYHSVHHGRSTMVQTHEDAYDVSTNVTSKQPVSA